MFINIKILQQERLINAKSNILHLSNYAWVRQACNQAEKSKNVE